MLTVPKFVKRKGGDSPLVVLTAYDAPTARAAEAAKVDAILVGDSVANVVLGYEDTLRVTVDDMIHHTAAADRGRRETLLIADMPWMSYHLSAEQAAANAARLVREGHADAVKLEGGAKRLDAIRAIVDCEIPVMGHLGLTPQSVLAMGGYRVQGREAEVAQQIIDDAKALQQAGVFSLVIEGVPAPLAKRVTEALSIPTIGIGAGLDCDGQVLVYHDLLGLIPDASPKFVRQYADLFAESVSAIERWAEDVRQKRFPAAEECY